MTNKQDFGGTENGNSDELNRGNNGNEAPASGDAGAILTPADLEAFEPGRVYKITGESPIEPAASKKATTPWYLSRTFWINLVALLSLFLPSVREWLENNPVDFVAALGGVNVLLRFVTYGKYQISSDNDDDSESGTGDGTGNELESRPPVPGNNDLANSSIAGAGTANPVKPSTIKRRALLTIGALMVLLGGSCSSTPPASSTSVSLSEGQAVIVRGGSSLVIDRGERKLLWNQNAPEVVTAPPAAQAK